MECTWNVPFRVINIWRVSSFGFKLHPVAIEIISNPISASRNLKQADYKNAQGSKYWKRNENSNRKPFSSIFDLIQTSLESREDVANKTF